MSTSHGNAQTTPLSLVGMVRRTLEGAMPVAHVAIGLSGKECWAHKWLA